MSLDSIEYKLGEISGQLDMLLKQLPSLHRRVAALETFKWKLAGALVVFNGLAAFAVEWYVHVGHK